MKRCVSGSDPWQKLDCGCRQTRSCSHPKCFCRVLPVMTFLCLMHIEEENARRREWHARRSSS